MKACIDCPNLTPTGPRCTTCTRTRDKTRGTRQQRGYDAHHDQLRATYQRRMNRGEHFTCWRCGDPINPELWHLGHQDEDRTVYMGPECVPCNCATSGRHLA